MQELDNYYIACNKLKEKFVEKYFEYDDSYWVGDEIAGVLSVGDEFWEMRNIITLMEAQATEKEKDSWYWWVIDFYEKDKQPPLNLKNFILQYRTDKTKITNL